MERILSFLYWHIYRPVFQLSIILLHYLPTKRNRIVFIQWNGRGYGCNLKYIAQYFIDNDDKLDLVWLVNDFKSTIPDKITQVKIGRIKAVWMLSTARIVINNDKCGIHVNKKKEQKFIYIPHGQSGAKRTERDGNLSKEYCEISKAHSSMMDLFITSSKYQTDDVKEFYWCNCDVLQLGFPRNDIFFQDHPEIRTKVCNTYRIEKDSHILFYTPTFRECGDDSPFAIELETIIDTLKYKFGGKWTAMVSLHPHFRWYNKATYTFSDKIKNVSGSEDIQELLYSSDVLITDYSSTMLDFALSRKPVFLFATDVEKYKKSRGLKDMYYQMPFPLCTTNNELISAIKILDLEKYQKEVKDFYSNKLGSVDDGNSTERVCKTLMNIIKN